MREWKSILIPLDRGLGEDAAENASNVVFTRAINVDFGRKGAVRGRPGYVRATGGYNLVSQVSGAPSITNYGSLSTTGYSLQEPFAVTDKHGERAAQLLNGRIVTYEGDSWLDRLGAGATRVDRVTDYLSSVTNDNEPAAFQPPVMGYDFGPGQLDQRLTLLEATGERSLDLAGPARGIGTMAAGGSNGGTPTTATVHVPSGTNNLVLTLRVTGTRAITTTTLATDAATPAGYGDAPVICADHGFGAGFWVAYRSTTAHTVKLLSLNISGTILNTASVTYGTGTIVGLWLTNGNFNGSITPVVLALADSLTPGLKTKVFSASLADQAIDATIAGSTLFWGPIVVGAADAATNRVWVCGIGSNGGLYLSTRQLNSATVVDYVNFWGGQYVGPVMNANYRAHSWYIQHQPILVGGRVILGLATARSVSAAYQGHQVATWYDVDLTDLAVPSGSVGSRLTPPVIARGVTDGSGIPFQPFSAVIGTDGNSWRFGSLDWSSFSGGNLFQFIVGYDGTLGMNEVSFQAPQVTHIGNTTVIGGSIPRAISGGAAYDLSYPWLGFPVVDVSVGGTGGGWGTGSYTVSGCWKWVDESGQVHRSASCPGIQINVTSGQKITFLGTPCVLTDRAMLQLNDRGPIYLEFYISQLNPAANAPLYFVGQALAGSQAGQVSTAALSGPTDTTQLPLYSTGLMSSAHMPVSADGGVATVGRRCFVSDGDFVYASLLGQDGDPPQWAGEADARAGGATQALTISVPAGAGRILSLAPLDDKLIIGCERGIYALAGHGPDDTGLNNDYDDPFLVSPLGVSHTRAMVATSRGVVFQAANQQVGDSIRGGLWLVDKSLQTALISWPVRDAIDATLPGRLCYVPERGTLFYVVPAPVGLAPPSLSLGGGGVAGLGASITRPYLLVWDMHVNQWALWTSSPDGVTDVSAVQGYLWTAGADAGGFINLPGTGYDDVNGSHTNFTMELQTNNMAANGEDNLGWSRVRSLRVLGDVEATAHSLTMSYVQDDALSTNTARSASHTFALPANQQQTTGWPIDRYAPEWRLLHQKCSTIQVDIQATPAVAEWTALELQVKPERRAPAQFRA